MGRLEQHHFHPPARSDDLELFAFESDFVATLRCIPMAVRFKLDHAGIKLSLRQWSRFTLADRSLLLTMPCASPAETISYRVRLIELVALRIGESAKHVPPPDEAPWAAEAPLPAALCDYARSEGLEPPSSEQWRDLTDLRRFTLLKLIRDGHDNVNFEPALREFGL